MTKKADATAETAGSVGVKKRSARFAALNRTAAEHLDDFHTFMEEEYEAHGLKYVRPPSEEEEAEQQVAALLLKFPRLRARIADALQVEAKPVGKRVPVDVPGIKDDVDLPPVDDDGELPAGTTYEQLERAADPWEGK